MIFWAILIFNKNKMNILKLGKESQISVPSMELTRSTNIRYGNKYNATIIDYYKRGRVFPMVIWPAFRMGQYRVNDQSLPRTPVYVISYLSVPKSVRRSSNHVFEKTILIHFGSSSKIMITCQRRFWSTFEMFEKALLVHSFWKWPKIAFDRDSKRKQSGSKSPFRNNSYTWFELLLTLFGTKKLDVR